MSRRQFTATTSFAAAAVVAGGARRVLGANDRVVLASIGIRGQGDSLKQGFAKLPGVEIKTLCDIDENLFAQPGERPRAEGRRDLQARLPEGPAAGLRRQGHRRRHRRDPEPLARPRHDLGAAGGQARVRREAGLPHGLGRPQDGRGGAALREGRAGRHDEPQPPRGPPGDPVPPRGRDRQGLHGARPVLQVAPGDREVPRRPHHRRQAAPPERRGGPRARGRVGRGVPREGGLRPVARPGARRGRSTATASTTTGTGTGPTATATPATRARTSSTSPAGASNKNEHPVKLSSTGGYFGPPASQETPDTHTTLFEYADGTLFEFATRGAVHERRGHAAHRQPLLRDEGLGLDRRRRPQVAELLRPQEREGPGLRGPAGAGRQRPERPHEPGVVALRELRRRHPRERPEEAHLRHRGGPPVGLARAPGEHRLPGRPAAEVRREDGDVRGRRRGRRAPHAPVPRAVRHPGQGVVSPRDPSEDVRVPASSDRTAVPRDLRIGGLHRREPARDVARLVDGAARRRDPRL